MTSFNCVRAGVIVGNGPNDAWSKADAALKTWPSLAPQYAATGGFPRTAVGALQAQRALATVQAAEAASGKAGAGDPLHVGFGGDPKQEAAFDHDFEHGAAAAAGDLRGEVAANTKFAMRSEVNSGAAARAGDLVGAERDHAAAQFIGVAESDLDRAAAGVRGVDAVTSAVRGRVDGGRQALRDGALRALESFKPH